MKRKSLLAAFLLRLCPAHRQSLKQTEVQPDFTEFGCRTARRAWGSIHRCWKLALVSLLLGAAGGAQTVVQSANCLATSTNNCTATFGSATTAGNAIYICTQQGQDATTPASIRDSASQTYTQISSGYDSNSNAGNRMACWIKTNSASISSVTSTWGFFLSTTIRSVALEISGIASSAAEDASVKQDSGSSAVTSFTTGSLSTSNAADILIACFGWGGDTSSPVAGTGYTIPTHGSNARIACEATTVSTTQSAVTASLSWTTGQDVDTIFAALKAGSGGGTSPSITSLTPSSGAVGSSIVIAGTNFGSSQGTVTFNGTAATTVGPWSTTSITATVPPGATTGNVVVTTSGGVSSNGVSFTVTGAPNISSLSPTSGAVGTSVTISGTNFGSSQGSVTFNGTTTTTVGPWNATSITASVPPGATTGNVVVTAAGGVASNGVSFTVTSGGGGQTVVQAANCLATSASSCTATFGSATTAGNAIYICAQQGQDSTTGASVTDSASQTYTQTSSGYDSNSNAGNRMGCWIKTNSAAISSVTNTWGGVSTTIRSVALEISGTASSAAEDASVNQDNGSSSATSLATGSLSTANASDILIACFGWGGDTSSPVAGTGYTIPTHGSNARLACEAKSVSTTQSAVTASLSWTTGQDVDTIFAALKGGSGGGTSPSITSLTPSSGAIGSSIVIAGSNFGSSQGTVTFNGTAATTISNWSTTSVTASVPPGTTTGNVVVTTSGGVSSNGVNFTVLAGAPIVQSNSGWSTGNAAPAIEFSDPNAAGNLLWVAVGTADSITSPTDTLGNVYTLAAQTTGVSGNVAVYYVASAKAGSNIVTCNHSGSSDVHCHIAEVTALATSQPLDQTGTVSASSTCLVSTAGATAQPNEWVAAFFYEKAHGDNLIVGNGYDQIELSDNTTGGDSGLSQTATGSSGAVQTATCGGNGSDLMSGVITTFKTLNGGVRPSISNLTPSSGAVGSSIVIAGSNFGSSQGTTSTVTFNGIAATQVGPWSGNSITATVPLGATTGNVVVTVADLASNGVSFTVLPNITSISPNSGAVSSSIVIAGTNFGSSQGTVTFNGTAATTISNWSTTSITASVPPGATTGNVVVTTSGGVSSNGVSFTVTGAPNISSLSPTSGAVGTSVTISGTNFGSSQGSVTFNGTPATSISSWSNTSIAASVPPGATTGNVVVTAAGGVASNGVSFTVLNPTPYSFHVIYMPNGDIASANDSVNGNWTYTYDDFNRLATANNSAPTQGFSYSYDQYGNRWHQTLTAGSGGQSNLTFSSNPSAGTIGNCYHAAGVTNQPDGLCYDAAGNLLNDGTHSYTYDAENRIVTVDANLQPTTAAYVYDAEGQRVRKVSSAGTADYVYDSAGHVISEFNASGVWTRGEVYAGTRHFATYNNGTTYFNQSDWLGTERARTLLTGAQCETILNLPFGDGQTTAGSCDPSPNHFTGKERDTETGLDYFVARYYSNGTGRFVTPDWAAKPAAVPYAVLGDPQSLNLYSYVRNIPTTRLDKDGHLIILNGDNKQQQDAQARIVANASAKGEAALFKTETDKDGKTRLVVDKKARAAFNGEHSAGFEKLVQAINNEHTITVSISDTVKNPETGEVKDVGKTGNGGVTLWYTNGDSDVTLTPNGATRPVPLQNGGSEVPSKSIIAGHEILGHALENATGGDHSEPHAIQIENILRGEQGLPLRDQ